MSGLFLRMVAGDQCIGMAVSNLVRGFEKGDLLHVLPVAYRIKEDAPMRHGLSISLFDRRKARSWSSVFLFAAMCVVQSTMIDRVIRRVGHFHVHASAMPSAWQTDFISLRCVTRGNARSVFDPEQERVPPWESHSPSSYCLPVTGAGHLYAGNADGLAADKNSPPPTAVSPTS